MAAIDPKLAKILELWRRTENDGERQAARARAEKLATKAGMTFEEAIALDRGDKQRGAPSGFSTFDFAKGFDDYMEEKEPGWKAKKAAERIDKLRARLARKAALVERHGSLRAAIAPCEREAKINVAVTRWRVMRKPPHDAWTDSVDGCSDGYEWKKLAPEVIEAIRGAYHWPETFPEALAERRYWEERMTDLSALHDDEEGNCLLDLPADIRRRMVELHIEEGLEVKSIADLFARFKHYRDRQFHDPDRETRIFHDLEGLVALQADRSSATDTCEAASVHGREHIEAVLRRDPSRSDRAIARELGVSPTTVGKARTRLGLAAEVRSVQRRGQIYAARVGRG